MIKKILTALVLLGFYFVAAALGNGLGYGHDTEGKPHLVLCAQRPPKPLTCEYHGRLSPACKRILNQAASILKKNPTASVVMYGGDDSTGEMLTSLGIDANRIYEKPFSGNTLTLIIRGLK